MSIVETINQLYDDEADVMYISIGEPRPALSKASKECDAILIRYDMKTREVCGATIYGYSRFDKDYLKKHIPIDGLVL